MTTMSSSLRLALFSSLFLLLSLLPLPACAQYTLISSALYSFELPALNATVPYQYSPAASVALPFLWTNQSGIALTGSVFDPPPPVAPPQGSQYAFIQVNPSGAGSPTSFLSAPLLGLTPLFPYYVTFTYAIRARQTLHDTTLGNQTQSQVIVSVNGAAVWTSVANLTDAGGWVQATSAAFTPPLAMSAASLLTITVTSIGTDDHCILFDTIAVAPSASGLSRSLTSTSASFPLTTSQTYGFEAPVVSTYQGTPPTNASNPWVFDAQAGVARTGSTWDPPPPIAPPEGQQYAYLQVSPSGALNPFANISGVVSGLSSAVTYTLSLSYAARARTGLHDTLTAGNVTESQLFVLVDGVIVWASAVNITDAGGWTSSGASQPFSPLSTNAGLARVTIFADSGLTTEDHAILVDNVVIRVAGSVVILPSSTASVAPSTSAPSPSTAAPSPGVVANLGGATYGNVSMIQYAIYSFETPLLPAAGYAYTPPTTSALPFNFTGQSGIAATGSVFDPPPPIAPPAGQQYAFLQVNPSGAGSPTVSLQAALTGLNPAATYVLSFAYALRARQTLHDSTLGNQTQSQLFVTLGGSTLWVSAVNLSESGGWMSVLTAPFTPPTLVGSQAILSFTVNSTGTDDHCILLDAVSVYNSMGSNSPLITAAPLYALSASATSSFETPTLNSTVQYIYTPFPSFSQWTFDNQSGIAITGSAFDPPPPIAPPAGQQYAFMQVSPSGAGAPYSLVSTYLSSLSPASAGSYSLTFSYAVRARTALHDTLSAGNVTESQLFVLVDNAIVWASKVNLTDAGGWTQATTIPFAPIAGNEGYVNVKLVVVSLITTEDHTILVDAVSFAFTPSTPTSSSTGATAPAPVAATSAPAVVANVWSLAPSTLYSFESPAVTLYQYQPTPAASNPWTYSNQSGIAATNSSWDPPPPISPPDGMQYLYLQVNPSGAGAAQTAVSASLSGLSTSSLYSLSFYYAVRARQALHDSTLGNLTSSQLLVSVNGASVWTSVANVTDAGGWTKVIAIPFSTTTGTATLTFTVNSITRDDHAILIDAVLIQANGTTGSTTPGGAGTSGGGGGSSLSGGAIAGIVIGSFAGAMALCVVMWLVCGGMSRRGGKKATSSYEQPDHSHTEHVDEEGRGHTNDDEVEMSTH